MHGTAITARTTSPASSRKGRHPLSTFLSCCHRSGMRHWARSVPSLQCAASACCLTTWAGIVGGARLANADRTSPATVTRCVAGMIPPGCEAGMRYEDCGESPTIMMLVRLRCGLMLSLIAAECGAPVALNSICSSRRVQSYRKTLFGSLAFHAHQIQDNELSSSEVSKRGASGMAGYHLAWQKYPLFRGKAP